MKTIFSILFLGAFFSACNDDATAEQELDTLGQKIEKGWDSTKAEVKELKDSVKSKWENRKDSTGKDSVKSK